MQQENRIIVARRKSGSNMSIYFDKTEDVTNKLVQILKYGRGR